VDAFRLQAERSIQDAAEARAKREELERAIQQYEMLLNAMGLGASSMDEDANALRTRIDELERKQSAVGLTPEKERELQQAQKKLGELDQLANDIADTKDRIGELERKKLTDPDGFTPAEQNELNRLKNRLGGLANPLANALLDAPGVGQVAGADGSPAGRQHKKGYRGGFGSPGLAGEPGAEGGRQGAEDAAYGPESSQGGGYPDGAGFGGGRGYPGAGSGRQGPEDAYGPDGSASLGRVGPGGPGGRGGRVGAGDNDAAYNDGLGDNLPNDPQELRDRINALARKKARQGLTPDEEDQLDNLRDRLEQLCGPGGGYGGGGPGSWGPGGGAHKRGPGLGDGSGGGGGGQPVPTLSVAPALPATLEQLNLFVLLTDEGHVAVRGRLNGTIAYLKRQVATQLHISPRLTLAVSSSSSSQPLNDDVIIAQYAEGKGTERLLLSAAPRPLSDFFAGSSSLPPLRQVRVRPCKGGVPESTSVIIKGVRATTTVREVQEMLVKQPGLLPALVGKPPAAMHLYFSPVFITPDVLLGRAERQVLMPSMTLTSMQVVDNDILYLFLD